MLEMEEFRVSLRVNDKELAVWKSGEMWLAPTAGHLYADARRAMYTELYVEFRSQGVEGEVLEACCAEVMRRWRSR